MKLTSKQKAFLRKEAHHLDPVVRVGKDGYSEELIKSILEAITNRELMKVKILQNSDENKDDFITKLTEDTLVQIVGVIGRTIILYKQNEEKETLLTKELRNHK